MSADALTSAPTSKTFSSFGADINLLTEVPTGAAKAPGRPCRRIRINAGSGSLAIRYADGSTDTIPGLSAGDVIDPTYRQAATAAGSGVVAALDAEHFLADLEDRSVEVPAAEAAEVIVG